MHAVVFDGRLKYVKQHPIPDVPDGWVCVRVLLAGICRTDIEILHGYKKGFHGVLGHEFVGVRAESADSATAPRVVGEINVGCHACERCRHGLERHCADRRVLGIHGLDGCMAEYCALPAANVIDVPAGISDERAVFTEPLAAACEILEQVQLSGAERAVVLGDGKLGILCAWVLSSVLDDVTLVGRHPSKLDAALWRHVRTSQGVAGVPTGADLVVEATGRDSGLRDAMALCRPRGTIVLKSTVAAEHRLDLAPLVVHEQTLVGSRCGRFGDALRLMQQFPDLPLERLITARYPLAKADAAFQRSQEPDALKVLLSVAPVGG